MIATVAAIGTHRSSPSDATAPLPVASAAAGPVSPAGVNRPSDGTADAIDRTSRATKPIPAAAPVDPVTVEARNVMAAHAASASQASAAIATQPAIGGGSNRIAV